MIRELTDKERAAVEPEAMALRDIHQARRDLDQRKAEVEARLQRVCNLIVEDGQAVDLERMAIVETTEPEDAEDAEKRSQ